MVKMAPVPRPPIICYDLQTNENPRRPIDSILHPYDRTNAANYHHPTHRSPLTCSRTATTNRNNKPKVTVIQKDPNELRQQLKLEAKEHERRAEYKRKQLEQLDKVTAQLESAKKVQENLLKTFGMSHNAAKYIQKQDEDFAALRRKVDQFAVTRSKEISQRVRQMKRLHELQQSQDRVAEEKRLAYLDTKFTPLDHPVTDYNTTATTTATSNTNSTIHTRNTTNSRATADTSTSFSSQGSSSTISLSSTCSSSNMSTDNSTQLSSIEFAEPTLLKNRNVTNISSSRRNASRAPSQQKSNPTIKSIPAPTPTHHHHSMNNSKPANKAFSFYKGDPSARDETLEVMDMEFFEKVEDKTMIEVNDLVQKLKAEIECFGSF